MTIAISTPNIVASIGCCGSRILGCKLRQEPAAEVDNIRNLEAAVAIDARVVGNFTAEEAVGVDDVFLAGPGPRDRVVVRRPVAVSVRPRGRVSRRGSRRTGRPPRLTVGAGGGSARCRG
jgi:hypothetical protein